MAKKIDVPNILCRLDAIKAHVEKTCDGVRVQREGLGAIERMPSIPTGSIKLDAALGVGGYPHGRVVEIYGIESSGKTTLSLHAIASAQSKGNVAAFIDAEHSLDPVYATALGVNLEQLLIIQPDYGEQALDAVDTLLDKGVFGPGDIIVVDSVAALIPKAELDGDMGDTYMGLQARLMSQALRKIAGRCAAAGVVIVFINQMRDKIGGYGGKTTTGGNALRYYATIRIEIRRISTTKAVVKGSGSDEEVAFANVIGIHIVKNKVAPPFRQVETIIRFGEGISRVDEILDLAVHYKLVEVAGSWYSMAGGERLGQGKENTIASLKATPLTVKALEETLRVLINPPIAPPVTAVA